MEMSSAPVSILAHFPVSHIDEDVSQVNDNDEGLPTGEGESSLDNQEAINIRVRTFTDADLDTSS